MEFNRGESELLSNLRVFDFTSLVERKALDTLGHVRTGGNGASAAKRLELDVRDNTVIVDTYLQLHNVATSVPMTHENKRWTGTGTINFFSCGQPVSAGRRR